LRKELNIYEYSLKIILKEDGDLLKRTGNQPEERFL
jgi:hypothetical protein